MLETRRDIKQSSENNYVHTKRDINQQNLKQLVDIRIVKF